jgi:hypothetical protein
LEVLSIRRLSNWCAQTLKLKLKLLIIMLLAEHANFVLQNTGTLQLLASHERNGRSGAEPLIIDRRVEILG